MGCVKYINIIKYTCKIYFFMPEYSTTSTTILNSLPKYDS